MFVLLLIHDKSATSFKESHDRVPWYLILIHSTIFSFTFIINEQRYFPHEFSLTTE